MKISFVQNLTLENSMYFPTTSFGFSSGVALEKMKKVAKSVKINAIDSLAMLDRNEN